MCVCVVSFIYPDTCGPKAHGTSSAPSSSGLYKIRVLFRPDRLGDVIMGFPASSCSPVRQKSKKTKEKRKETTRPSEGSWPLALVLGTAISHRAAPLSANPARGDRPAGARLLAHS